MKPPMPTILRGDARQLPLPDASVDLVVTSPPYFNLRAYQDGGQAYDGQIGAEATPREFVDALIECTREWMRVLKPPGSLFVNLGDKYGPDKSLLDLPWRYSIRCVDELGLIKRAEIVWSKPSAMPESVTDRVRRSHEVFLHLTMQSQYFSSVDEIREPHAPDTLRPSKAGATAMNARNVNLPRGGATAYVGPNPLGRLPGSVWEISTQPLKVPADLGVDHFAAFPTAWPRRIIQGWSPQEVCIECGEGRRPVVDKGERQQAGHGGKDVGDARRLGAGRLSGENSTLRTIATRAITGYACACPDTSAASTPGVVLDPFSGTGTTALVAAMLGRRGIGVDLSADYCRLAQWRASDPKERARAAGLDPDAVAKVAPRNDAQFDLFGQSA